MEFITIENMESNEISDNQKLLECLLPNGLQQPRMNFIDVEEIKEMPNEL